MDETMPMSATAAFDELADDPSYVMASDYVQYRLGKAGFSGASAEPPNRHCALMRRMGDEFEQRYAEVFDDMGVALQLTPDTAYSTFLGVCEELFRGTDEQPEIKWGRVVALFVFGGALAVQCVGNQMQQQVDEIPGWVAGYVRRHLAHWIESHGGWDGFIRYYEKNPEHDNWSFKKVLTGVGAVCGALGVVTLGAMFAGRP